MSTRSHRRPMVFKFILIDAGISLIGNPTVSDSTFRTPSFPCSLLMHCFYVLYFLFLLHFVTLRPWSDTVQRCLRLETGSRLKNNNRYQPSGCSLVTPVTFPFELCSGDSFYLTPSLHFEPLLLPKSQASNALHQFSGYRTLIFRWPY